MCLTALASSDCGRRCRATHLTSSGRAGRAAAGASRWRGAALTDSGAPGRAARRSLSEFCTRHRFYFRFRHDTRRPPWQQTRQRRQPWPSSSSSGLTSSAAVAAAAATEASHTLRIRIPSRRTGTVRFSDAGAASRPVAAAAAAVALQCTTAHGEKEKESCGSNATRPSSRTM